MTASSTLQLRYLFGAHFADGSEYFQTEDDVSQSDPKRSAFYDLCLHSETGDSLCDDNGTAIVRGDIELFQLDGQGHIYLVDLRDGHFEIDGAPFYIQIPKPNAKLSLVNFRRRRHHQNITYRISDGEILDREDGVEECEYHFGWRDLNSDSPPVTLILG